MSKNIGMIVGVLALVLIIGGIYNLTNEKDSAMMSREEVESKAMEEVESEAMMENEQVVPEENAMMEAGSYEAYTPEKVALASATEDVVLFFRASWCPTCRAVDADIKANLSKIPSNLTILDVNYDDSTTLKQKYGVTYQHTFVQVDKDGNLIMKWSGSPTLSDLVAKVK